jgi:DNA-binding protein Fis
MTVYELPSLIALIFKLVLLAYSAKSPIKSSLTKAFLALLVLLSLFNLLEFAGLSYYAGHAFDSRLANLFGLPYIGLLIASIAVLLHVSLRISFDSSSSERRFLPLIYVPVIVLECLLFFTDKLVLGFSPYLYTVLRVPGPLYFLFETFAITYLLAALANLIWGARATRPSIERIRNRFWLLAMAPMALLIAFIIVANHFGGTKITSTFYAPMAMTFFLVVTSYATHQYRLFDIEFFIPWSRVRKRKTAFYQRIQAMIGEIANLGAVDKAVEKLSETLRCSVALVGTNKPALALANGSTFMTEIPADVLRKFDRIVVANEIAETLPDMHAVMKNHGVAAIVPFHPHSKHAQGWLLLGDSFSEQVYTARDFRLVEQLFDKMADLFLDQVMAMRVQLSDAAKQIRVLERRQHQLYVDIDALQDKNQVLERQVMQMLREQRADAIGAQAAVGHMPQLTAATITLIGRDKPLLKRLRVLYPQVEQFASMNSASFARQAPPELLIARLEGDAEHDGALLRWLSERGATAGLLYGQANETVLAAHKDALRGALIEQLPPDFTDEALARRVQALAELRRHLFDTQDAEQPLLGHSILFTDLMAEAQRVAPIAEAVVIQTDDTKQGLALAAYVHGLSGIQGVVTAVRADALLTISDDAWPEGTLAVTDVISVSEALAARLIDLRKTKHWRLMVIVSDVADVHALKNALYPFTLTMPAVSERKADVPLLVHYFTVQFNLQAGSCCHFLRQAEVDEMMQAGCPVTVAELRHQVFEMLKSRLPARAGDAVELGGRLSDKTLDEHIVEYETYIIEQTIKRCDGNKSKAARLLGLRPNTLHYKLRRYGVVSEQGP